MTTFPLVLPALLIVAAVVAVVAWRRHHRLIATAATLGLPVAWNLAGGYQTPLRKVLDIHDNTMTECYRIYVPGAANLKPP